MSEACHTVDNGQGVKAGRGGVSAEKGGGGGIAVHAVH